MAHYRASIDIQQPREEVFAYLSDFSTTREWDPGVVEAERLNGQAVGEGTEFRLVAEFLGRKNELTYRIVEYDPPHAVTFLGENATVVSRDRITFDSTAAGTRVTYDADLALKGLLRIADPDASARARTITVYTDVGKVADNLGLAGTETIAVLIVERSGRILAREVGGFEEQKAERLAAALAPTPSSTATVT